MHAAETRELEYCNERARREELSRRAIMEKSMLPDERDLSTETFESYGSSQLTSLARAVGFGDEADDLVRTFKQMVIPWGEWRIGEVPRWPSDVCADGSPIEFSIACHESDLELRVLLEALSPIPTLPHMQDAARQLTERLEVAFGISTQRLRLLDDLFFPSQPQGGYAMMHAVIFQPGRPPAFKCYLNPEAQGESHSSELIREALLRLGFDRAWQSVLRYAHRGLDLDKLVYLSLDLDDHEDARVKVYFRHFLASAAEIDEAMSMVRGHASEHLASLASLASFCKEVAGHDGPFTTQPIVSCLSFTAPAADLPSAATMYVPVWTYAENDAVTRDRIRRCLRSRGLSVDVYDAALKSVARRPLEMANGIHTYASLRVHQGRPRVTVYWSSELYGRNPPPRYQRSGPQAAAKILRPDSGI